MFLKISRDRFLCTLALPCTMNGSMVSMRMKKQWNVLTCNNISRIKKIGGVLFKIP